MDRNLAIEFVRVTEAAAVASARLMGRGDRDAADQAAVDAMRKALNSMDISGTVVIGEGERDEAPMLYIGEKVGKGQGPKIDIALDPLEGTNLCATGAPNAIAVLACAEDGKFLHAPDTYMNKIAVGPEAVGVIDILATPTENLKNIAKAKKCSVEDLTVVILDRERHQDMINEVRANGARIKLIGDGDISAALSACFKGTGIDVLMGTGGAPEGVITAAALRCIGGDMQGQLQFRNEEEKKRAARMGITDFDKVYSITDLADGDVIFAATGVTNGDFLKGVNFFGGGGTTQSIVLRSKSRTIRYVEATHYFDRKSYW